MEHPTGARNPRYRSWPLADGRTALEVFALTRAGGLKADLERLAAEGAAARKDALLLEAYERSDATSR